MNGIILINKPKGITSRDVVNYISKTLDIKKIGHNGTLDPLAEGVLVICLGKYTKLNEILSSEEKEYIAEVKLGYFTDTLDITGTVLGEGEVNLTLENLKNVFDNFPRRYLQEVPKYSAVKVKGKKLYEYAREGIDVELPKKEVLIKELELLSFEGDTFTFKTMVSKGTYIRSLIRDLLLMAGAIGTMSNLTRTRQGKFTLEEACSLEDIEKGNYKLLKVKDISNIQTVIIDNMLKKKILNGAKIIGNYPNRVLFVDETGTELAIYIRDGNVMKVDVML